MQQAAAVLSSGDEEETSRTSSSSSSSSFMSVVPLGNVVCDISQSISSVCQRNEHSNNNI
jgi:hypothetical protein